MRWIRFLATVVMGAQLCACSNGGGGGDAEAKKLLDEYGCTTCHSVDGSKVVGPTLRGLFGSRVKVLTDGQARELTADEEYLRRSILDPGADVVEGYSSSMPDRYKGEISPENLSKIIEYMKTL